ncbi:MAG: GNAT family N-acetyltransferase [Candidatus Eisenbacteria bacterium]|nr:GNAT family N-acetyltransferase [Candidatus Eisenbacteria bacterium]
MQQHLAVLRDAPDPSPRLDFDWIQSPAGFFRLRRRWDEWHARLGVDNVFQSYDWLRLWLRIYEPGARLLIGIARSAGEIAGIAPFYFANEKVTPFGPTLHAVRLLGDGTLCPDHIVIPVRRGHEERFAAGVLEHLRSISHEWDRVELRDLRSGQPVLRPLHDHAAMGQDEPAIRERTHCPFVALPSTWEEYLDSLGSKTRKTIRQRWNRIERDLSATLPRPADRADLDRLMAHLEELHGRSWEKRGRTGVFACARFRAFHRLHARRAFRSKRLWMLALRSPDRVLAVTLGFRDARAAHGYQIGHDPDARAYGIGSVMVALSIRSAIEDGLSEMDFLRGAGDYKYHFAAQERRGLDFVLHAGTLPDQAAQAAAQLRSGAGSLLRGTIGREPTRWIKRHLRMT